MCIRDRGDTLAEGHEAYFVNLSGPTNATIADGQGTGVILDDDSPPVVELTNPAPGLVLSAPADVDLGALAHGPECTLRKVAFFANTTTLSEATTGSTTFP